MSTRIHLLLVSAVTVACSSCTRLEDALDGLQRFVDVSALVDDVAFLPLEEGRRSVDSTGPTLVTPEVAAVEIVFIEALDAESVSGFSAERNLIFEGVSPDPDRPAFLNAQSIGKRRAFQVLTVPLAGPLPQGGPFHVKLVSSVGQDGNLLRTVGQTTPFVGTYDIAFEVMARDGDPPFVERLVTSVGTIEKVPVTSFAAEALTVEFIEPHADVRFEFSEEMRPGVPVVISPTLPVEEERSIGGRTLRFFRPTFPGFTLLERLESEFEGGTPRTVLVTKPDEVRPVGVDFEVRIPSNTSLAPQGTLAADISGEPLVANLDVQARLVADFHVVLRVGSVSISSPVDGSFLNAEALSGPLVQVSGIGTAEAGEILVSVLGEDQQEELSLASASYTGLTATTQWGKLVRTWTANIPSTAFDEDGEVFLRASSVTSGTDTISVVVDTTPPSLTGVSGTLDLFANDADHLDRVCVAVGPALPLLDPLDPPRRGTDAERAELLLPDGTVLEASGPESFEDDDGRSRFGFCWSDVDLGAVLPVGRTNLQVRLYDEAGNVGVESIEIRVHPWLQSVTPDHVPFGPVASREIVIRGVGLKTFTQAASDAVLVDGRDVLATIQKEIELGPPADFRLRLDVPQDAGRGGLTVRIDGLESNRLRFDVCTTPADKHVTELAFDDRVERRGRLAFSMERGPTGEPVFIWAEAGRIIRATADGESYDRTEDSIAPGVDVDVGSPVKALRLPDGTVASVWFSKTEIHAAGVASGTLSMPLQDPGLPVALDAAVDRNGTPYALVVSEIPIILDRKVVYARLFRLDGTDATGALVGMSVTDSSAAYSGRLAFGLDGTGWVLVSGAETRGWFLRDGVWQASGQVLDNAVVADVAVSRDGRRFFSAVWEIGGDPFDVGRRDVEGKLVLYEAGRLDTSWSARWMEDATFDERAFRPPLTGSEPLDEPRRILAGAAALAVDHERRAVLAYMDFSRRTLRLVRAGGELPADVLDLDVTLGHEISLSLDGNDDALVGYADLSHVTTMQRPEAGQTEEDDEREGVRRTASVQLVDTRNRIPVVAGMQTGPSVCSPGRFFSSTISRENWDFIRQHQRSRTPLEYESLYRAFLGTSIPANEQEGVLRAKQASAAVFSRLLSRGEFRFRGRVVAPGDTLPGTGHGGESLLPGENRGLRAPVGTTATTVTTISTGDAEISEISIAKFKPRERPNDCDQQPEPRNDAAMAFDPVTGTFVLFGGRGESGGDDTDGEIDADSGDFFFESTWRLSSTDPDCWVRVAASGPSPRIGHSMATAPNGRGVILFGGRDFTGSLRNDVWLFDPKAAGGQWIQLATLGGGPSSRRMASLAYDTTRERVWLYGGRRGQTRLGDLWYFDLGAVGTSVTWESASSISPPPLPRSEAGLVFEEKGNQLILFGGDKGLVGPIHFPVPVSNELWSYRIEPDPLQNRWEPISDEKSDSAEVDGQYVARARAGAAVVNRDGVLVIVSGSTRGLGFRPPVLLDEPKSIIPGNSTDFLDLTPYVPPDAPVDPDDAPAWSFTNAPELAPARERHAWAYDPAEQLLVLFGGEALGVRLDDTVALDMRGTPPFWDWNSLVPGDAEPVDAIAHGRSAQTPVQWGRGDFLPLLSIEGLAGALTALAPDDFPPIAQGVVSIDSYSLGPVEFEKLLDEAGLDPDGQGTFESRIDFGHFTANGRARFMVEIGGEEISATQHFEATSDIPSLVVPLPGGPVEILRPDACAVFLDGGHSDAHVRRIPMKTTLDLQPAVDARGPTEAAIQDNAALGLQSHTKVTGVTVKGTEDLAVPMCVQLPGQDVLIVSAPTGPFNQAFLALSETLGSRLASLPSQEVPNRGRGLLDDLLGAIVVDAFTNVGPDFGIDYETRRTRKYNSLSESPRCTGDDPQWVHLHPNGISLGLRGGDRPSPVPCSPIAFSP